LLIKSNLFAENAQNGPVHAAERRRISGFILAVIGEINLNLVGKGLTFFGLWKVQVVAASITKHVGESVEKVAKDLAFSVIQWHGFAFLRESLANRLPTNRTSVGIDLELSVVDGNGAAKGPLVHLLNLEAMLGRQSFKRLGVVVDVLILLFILPTVVEVGDGFCAFVNKGVDFLTFGGDGLAHTSYFLPESLAP